MNILQNRDGGAFGVSLQQLRQNALLRNVAFEESEYAAIQLPRNLLKRRQGSSRAKRFAAA